MSRQLLAILAALCVAGPGMLSAQERPQMDYESAHWKNYSNRSPGSQIRYIVIHTIEGPVSGAVNWFKNPEAEVSAHFVVGWEGEIIQMVDEDKKAWHAGRYNSESIGIEHAGWTHRDTWTDEQYRASARLARYLVDKYGIPIDRQHIVAHSDVPGATHGDPGPHFDWDYYFELIRNGDGPAVTALSPTADTTLGRDAFASTSDRSGRGLELEWEVRESLGEVAGFRILLAQDGRTLYDSGHQPGDASRVQLHYPLGNGAWSWKVRIATAGGAVKGTDWTPFRVDVSAPSVTLVSPTGGEEVDATPALRWSYRDGGKPQAGYRLWIDDDANHGTVIGDSGREDRDQQVHYPSSRLEPGQSYYWRVQVFDDAGNSALSPWGRFTMTEDSVDLRRAGRTVQLLSPRNGRRVDPSAGAPILRWAYHGHTNRPQQAARVFIDDDADHRTVSWQSGSLPGEVTAHRPNHRFVKGRTYYWRVRVWDGEETHYSGWTSFVLGEEASTPAAAAPGDRDDPDSADGPGILDAFRSFDD